MNYKEILVEAMKKAIAQGLSAAEISRQTGVAGSIISRIICGKQEDIRAGDYFKIINIMPQAIKTEAMLKLGIEQKGADELIPYLNAQEIAQIIAEINLTQEDAAHILNAMAKILDTLSQKISCASKGDRLTFYMCNF
jgi:transcriptional regulator with XRE-family HTH domain